ncbi:methyl-accepting chemotaxis protein, partial [Helicobacter sp. 11S02629-2]|uniref:cache domain-containing protein n=1 Tax=Helicobacter sp. 11S02629-2 TaxID=1476195 RepID=UPI000BA76E6B
MKKRLVGFTLMFFILCSLMSFLYYLNNRAQINLFEKSFSNQYYAGIDNKLRVATSSVASILGELVKGLPEKEQIAIIAKSMEKFRFENDNSGYYSAYQGTVSIAHPIRKDFVGHDMGNAKDEKGNLFIQMLHDSALNNGKIVQFYFTKPIGNGQTIIAPKRSVSFLIPNTNDMWITTGVYVDNVSHAIQDASAPIASDMEYSFVKIGIIALVVFLIISIPVSFVFYFYVVGSMTYIKDHLLDFFKALQKNDIADMKPLTKKLKSEFRVMATAINEVMAQTKESLSKDSSAVSQALEVAKTIEEGNLSIRITKNPANPQLLELKDVLNNMLDVLETKIGSNMNEIERVFDSYLRLDFSTSVLDDKGNIANKGSVERVTNALGEEIRKMLKSSLSFASLLNEEAKKLNTQITNLSTSSNAQASSLEQSATAIEEITQSMQN